MFFLGGNAAKLDFLLLVQNSNAASYMRISVRKVSYHCNRVSFCMVKDMAGGGRKSTWIMHLTDLRNLKHTGNLNLKSYPIFCCCLH